jgi:hypothetical protein
MASDLGASGKSQGDGGDAPLDLSPDDVIRNINKYGEPGQGAVAVTGYLGESPQDGHVRLYFDLGLKTYCDIAITDIVHRERIVRSDDANASRVFVGAGVVLRVVQEVEAEAFFLQGSIASSHPIRDEKTGFSIPQTIQTLTLISKQNCLTITITITTITTLTLISKKNCSDV